MPARTKTIQSDSTQHDRGYGARTHSSTDVVSPLSPHPIPLGHPTPQGGGGVDREEGEGAEYPEEGEGDGGGAEWVSPLYPHLHLSFPLSFHYFLLPLGSFFFILLWRTLGAGGCRLRRSTKQDRIRGCDNSPAGSVCGRINHLTHTGHLLHRPIIGYASLIASAYGGTQPRTAGQVESRASGSA